MGGMSVVANCHDAAKCPGGTLPGLLFKDNREEKFKGAQVVYTSS
ncbi:hypothetical protein J2R96_008392 [Bradyrhizobium elkanii]|nr:hypothetical protein [Bradyrhizobium elkanii]